MSYPRVVSELALVGLADAAVPNKERVIVRPTQLVSLKEFGLGLGIFDAETGGAKPVFDNVFWFPDMLVQPPAWILVYTGKGTPQETALANGERVLTLFWQRQYVMFTHELFLPFLFRLGGALVGQRIR